MMCPIDCHARADDYFDPAFLTFCWLPVVTLHGGWRSRLLTPQHWALLDSLITTPAAARTWQRYCSRALIRQLECVVVPVPVQHPATRLALLPQWEWERLVWRAGLALCAPVLMQQIGGVQVREVLAQLGPTSLSYLHDHAPFTYPGMVPRVMFSGDTPLLQWLHWYGAGALLCATSSLPSAWVQRVELRCPPDHRGGLPWPSELAVAWLDDLPPWSPGAPIAGESP